MFGDFWLRLSEELNIFTNELHKVAVVTSSWSKRNGTRLQLFGKMKLALSLL